MTYDWIEDPKGGTWSCLFFILFNWGVLVLNRFVSSCGWKIWADKRTCRCCYAHQMHHKKMGESYIFYSPIKLGQNTFVSECIWKEQTGNAKFSIMAVSCTWSIVMKRCKGFVFFFWWYLLYLHTAKRDSTDEGFNLWEPGVYDSTLG